MLKIAGTDAQTLDIPEDNRHFGFGATFSLANIDCTNIFWVNLANIFVNRRVVLRVIAQKNKLVAGVKRDDVLDFGLLVLVRTTAAAQEVGQIVFDVF